jgi:hypothetical protein
MQNTDMAAEDLIWVRNFIDERFWKFARTYAKTAPHSYTVRDWVLDPDDNFSVMVELIRKYGRAERFYSKVFYYLYLDGQKYWTMGDPVHQTTLINRCDWGNYYGAK